MEFALLLSLSIALQLTAAALSLRLIRLTGRSIAWLLLALAISLMALRRGLTLHHLLTTGVSATPGEWWPELVALGISALMVLGIGGIAPLFLSMKKTEQALRLNEAKLEGLYRLSQMTDSSLQEIMDFTMEEAVRLTHSQVGYLGLMNDDESVLTIHAWSREVMSRCAVLEQPIVYPLAGAGLWGEAVRQRRAIIVNDYAAPNPLKKGHPAGHVDISRYLSIPLMDGERIVALAGVANKVQPYDDADARQVVLLLHRMWRLVQQKQASQALTAEIERVHHFQERLIQTSQDGIIANDRDGNIILFNEGAENILGYRQEEVIGIIPVQQIYGPGGARAVKKALHGPTHGGPGRLIHFEAEVINKTGEAIPIEISASLVFEDGEEVAIVGFFRDLRERRALQERVLQAERLAVLGRMAAHIGHEIKNPLMVIGGFARQLLRDKSPDPAKLLEKLHIIADEVARLEEFLVEVGSYARLSEPHKQPGDLNALIKETCRRLEPILQERGLTLHLDLAPDLPTVHFDAGHLRQTVLNVAKNGLEAMGRGGVLTIVSGLQDGRVLVRFKDTGPGIPPEMMARLFTPFATTKPKGSGLGLAISRKIMEAHGGEIILECPPEGGTLVTLGFAPEDEGGDESED